MLSTVDDRSGGGTLSVVLAGHPKHKNDLARPSMEEIGARAAIFDVIGLFSINVGPFSRNVVQQGPIFSANVVPQPPMLSVPAIYVLGRYT